VQQQHARPRCGNVGDPLDQEPYSETTVVEEFRTDDEIEWAFRQSAERIREFEDHVGVRDAAPLRPRERGLRNVNRHNPGCR
jgi:hypothetical protein